MSDFKSLPKVELHLHFEGAAPPAFIRGLAREKSVDLSSIFAEDGAYIYRDFWQFLSVYEAACTVLTGPEEFARLTRAVLEECADQGVVYVETFLSPDFCGGGDLAAWQEYLAAIREEADQCRRDLGVTLRGIVTCIRHFGPDKARAAALCAAHTADDWLVGFGMAGDEKVGQQGDYAWAFDCAREAGLHLTTHAGEWGGAESVRQALDDLTGIERIGHGVQAIDDPGLVSRLAEGGITLEVCPVSNVTLGVYPDMPSHPIARLRSAGVPVTVSTDDPPFFHTTMTREYEALNRAFGWTDADFSELNRVALGAAFCSDDTRAEVARLLD